MKRGENSLYYLYKKGKIHGSLNNKKWFEIFLKKLSHIAPVSPMKKKYK